MGIVEVQGPAPEPHAQSAARSVGAPELSVVVPTFNEKESIRPLVKSLERALKDHDWEVIFVDDNSMDRTSVQAKSLSMSDARVRCIRRVGRRGLSSAVIEGILSSSAKYVAVMDGDLQHDERLLPGMLRSLNNDEADVVIASRYVDGGNAGGLVNVNRKMKSRLGNWLVNCFLGVQVSDPMSGYFMMPRTLFDKLAENLSGIGFKILLDILTSADTALRVREIPFTFRRRESGTSKLDLGVELAFVSMLIDKFVGKFIPWRFLLFSAIGGSGVFVHLAVLRSALLGGVTFATAQTAAAVTAMTTNFLLNNAITFRDQKLRGVQLVVGLLSFYAVCSVGLLGNIGVAQFLFDQQDNWWVAGLAGSLVGLIWNYSVSSNVTWRGDGR